MAQTALNQMEIGNQAKHASNDEQLSTAAQKPKTLFKRLPIKRLFKWVAYLLLISTVLISIFFGAMHYRLLDLDQLNSRFAEYPAVTELLSQAGPAKIAAENAVIAVGEYLGTQYTLIKAYISEPPDAETIVEPADSAPLSPPATVALTGAAGSTPAIMIDDTELKQKEALALAAEQKRLAKVASLYNLMKAEAAMPILNELDDETVILIFSKMEEEQVVKIMTLFEPSRSARLSDAILKGRGNR